MIDWLTLRLPVEHLTSAAHSHLSSQAGRIVGTTADGELRYCVSTRERLGPSDSGMQWRITDRYFELQGSPALVSKKNNVFGERDPLACHRTVCTLAQQALSIRLPTDPTAWQCTRMDITLNYAVSRAVDVERALQFLRHTGTRRRKVSTDGSTCYWNRASRYTSARAYAKGQHLDKMVRRNTMAATPDQQLLARHLLRLELLLRSKFWSRSRRHWHEHTAASLEALHRDYFGAMLEALQTPPVRDVERALKDALPRRRAEAIYDSWLYMQCHGTTALRTRLPGATFRRHLAALRAVGLTDADFDLAGQSAPPRTAVRLGRAVHSWDDLAETVQASEGLPSLGGIAA